MNKKTTQQKTLKDAAAYLKSIVPSNIPKSYSLKPLFKKIASEENIRDGVLAYRDFLYLLCDSLIADGSQYDKPTKNADAYLTMAERFPFLCYINNVLFKIGYHGTFAGSHDSLVLRDPQLLSKSAMAEGGCGKSNLSADKVINALTFLVDCGFYFDGIELDLPKPKLPELTKLEVTYPDNPAVLTGLKVMAIAQKELRTKNNHEIFQWCDYRFLMAQEPDAVSRLNDFAHSLPVKIRDFILKLHNHFLKAGLICVPSFCGIDLGFHYFHRNKEVCSFFASPNSGYRIFIKAQNTDKYPDIIKQFSLPLQEKIARGYGCNPKKFGEPCQIGCHGFSFPLDDSTPTLADEIKTWIDKELSCLRVKA